MTTAYTTLLGLALPVPGELTGTWGTTVNDSITQLLDDAIAGTATESVTSGDWTLTDTGSGAPNQARCAILIATGTPGVSRNIIAPARSKGYFVVNQSDAAVVLKGASTTGISISSGKSGLVIWNGSDFVAASGTVTSVGMTVPAFLSVSGSPITSSGTFAVSLSGTALPIANGGTGATSAATARANLGATTVGANVLTLTNPSAITFPQFNADNTVSALDAASFRTAIGAGSGGGTVTSVSGTAPVSVANGTTTPTISMPAATTSVNGYLTSTDWNIFNGKYSTGGALGTPSSGTLSSCTVDGTNAVGYKNIPQTGSDKTTAYTLVTGDVGKYVGVGTSGSIVVPTSTFANGDAISVYNNTTGNITITTSAPTAYIAGTNTVKTSITLATRGIATILFVSATVCVVSGNVS